MSETSTPAYPVPLHYGTVVHVPERKGWSPKVNNPTTMTPLSRSLYEDLGNQVFRTKEQAEAALYTIYSGDPADF